MSDVAIYIEGGGSFASQRQRLRVGFDAFFVSLKQLAAQRGKSFRLIACGSRDEAFHAFHNERKHDGTTVAFLLVDSEDVMISDVKTHLEQREHHWDLASVSKDKLHVMATTMETWVISDRVALGRFYDQHLRLSRLPVHANLEKVPKTDVCKELAAATRDCQSGVYHKMNHAPRILTLMNPVTVRQHCHHCNLLFQAVETVVLS